MGRSHEDQIAETTLIIQERCSQILGIDVVSPEDNFFGLGGDSLSAMEFVELCEEDFAIEINLRWLFDASSMREFGARILEGLAGKKAALSHPAEHDGSMRACK
jgi:acyl carrier protein